MEKKTKKKTTHGPSNIFYTLKTSRTLFFLRRQTDSNRTFPPPWHSQPHHLPRGTETASGRDTRITRMPGNRQWTMCTEHRAARWVPCTVPDRHPPSRLEGPLPTGGQGWGPSSPSGPPSATRISGAGAQGLLPQ